MCKINIESFNQIESHIQKYYNDYIKITYIDNGFEVSVIDENKNIWKDTNFFVYIDWDKALNNNLNKSILNDFCEFLIFTISKNYWIIKNKLQIKKINHIVLFSRSTIPLSYSNVLESNPIFLEFRLNNNRIKNHKIDIKYINALISQIKRYAILGTNISKKHDYGNNSNYASIMSMCFFYSLDKTKYKYSQKNNDVYPGEKDNLFNIYNQLLVYLREKKYININNEILLSGILNNTLNKKRKIFIAHKFGVDKEIITSIYELLNMLDFIPYSLELERKVGNIDSHIYNEIKNSFLTLGLLNPRIYNKNNHKEESIIEYNANVIYELGLSKGLGNLILPILKSKNSEELRLPFDISSHSALLYDDKDNLLEQLKIYLKSFL